MTSQAEEYGGSIRITISADQQLSRKRAWVWQITASGAGLAVQLPDARYIETIGYPVIMVVNEGANTFAIEDFDGTELIATGDNPQNRVYTFALFDKSTAAGDWESSLATQVASPGPSPTIFPWTLGGVDSGMNRNAWRYDFVADTWSEPGGLSSSLSHDFSAGFEISGIGYVTDDAAPITDSFNPTAWAAVTGKTTDGKNAAGAKHESDDKGYVLGSTASGDGADVESYDVSDDAWTSLTDMSDTRHKHAAQKGGSNDVLYHGGATSFLSFHDATTHMRRYDIGVDSHSKKTSSIFDRLYFSSSLDGQGNFWAFGGAEDSNGPDRDDVEKYTVSTDSWTTETLSPQGAHSQGGATRIAANGFTYTIGGITSGGNSDAVYQHTPGNDTYIVQTDHGAATGNARGISQGNTLSLTD